jgi:hypothetical protein
MVWGAWPVGSADADWAPRAAVNNGARAAARTGGSRGAPPASRKGHGRRQWAAWRRAARGERPALAPASPRPHSCPPFPRAGHQLRNSQEDDEEQEATQAPQDRRHQLIRSGARPRWFWAVWRQRTARPASCWRVAAAGLRAGPGVRPALKHGLQGHVNESETWFRCVGRASDGITMLSCVRAAGRAPGRRTQGRTPRPRMQANASTRRIPRLIYIPPTLI